jgi:hypothetical protein
MINVSSRPNGTYTLYFRAQNEVRTRSEVVSQSFNKVSSPSDTTPPVFVSSTPHNGAQHVSVATGSVSILFNKNILLTGDRSLNTGIYIYKLSDIGMTPITDGEDINLNTNTLEINHGMLDYNTTYVIKIPAGTIVDTLGNPTTTDINIYFTTQVGTAPDITLLVMEEVAYPTQWRLSFQTNIPRDELTTRQYRYSTTPYGGTWTGFGGGGLSINAGVMRQRIQETLQPNTTYWYQVRAVHQ